MARGAAGGFQRGMRGLGQAFHIHLGQLAREIERLRELGNKARVGGRYAAAQAVIEMADDQVVKAMRVQQVQQCDRVRAAGHADEVAQPARGGCKPRSGREICHGSNMNHAIVFAQPRIRA